MFTKTLFNCSSSPFSLKTSSLVIENLIFFSDNTFNFNDLEITLYKLTSLKIDGLEVTSRLEQKDLANRLGSYDVGILPMPEHKVWNLASPLKLSEYLASGLIVSGVDHSGHRMNNTDGFVKLFEEDDLITSTVNWLKELETSKLRELQAHARKKAEEDIDWSISVDVLENMISSIIDD